MASFYADENFPGIIVCTPDPDVEGQASRIDQAVRGVDMIRGLLLRINRPA